MTEPQASLPLVEAIRKGGPLANWFYQAARQAYERTQRDLTRPSAPHLAERIAAEAGRNVREGTERSPLAILRECSAGCSACCHTVAVDVTPLEALIVAEHLQLHCTQQQLHVIRQRLATNAQRRSAMTPSELQQIRIRCGLLGDDGLCQVYDVRPLVCAGVFSLSRAACEMAAQHSQSADQPVPLDKPAKAWTMGVSGGLQRALVEAGLDANLYELNSIVHRALETPNAVHRWLCREDIFRDCICIEAHSPPRRIEPQRRIDPSQKAEPNFLKNRAAARKKQRRNSR